MNAYTAQIARWPIVKQPNITMIDVTVKSGNPVFAPRWDMVMNHKHQGLSDWDYTEQYLIMMRDSYQHNRQEWMRVIDLQNVAFTCYCPPCTERKSVFCHRLLLVQLFRQVCLYHQLPYEYVGELTPGGLIKPRLPHIPYC